MPTGRSTAWAPGTCSPRARRPCSTGCSARAARAGARGRAAQAEHAAHAPAAAALGRGPGHGVRRHVPRARVRHRARDGLPAGRRRRDPGRAARRDLLPLADRRLDPRRRPARHRPPHPHRVRPAHARAAVRRPTRTVPASAPWPPRCGPSTASSPNRSRTASPATRPARPCLEVRSPVDLEADVGLPGGHIFHRDLAWPWAEHDDEVGAWGVETADPRVLIAGAGARRGGGVSGIPGRAAAIAVLGTA